MPYCEWDDENWRSLLHAIKYDNCLLMMGSGASLETYQNQVIPCTEVLAHELAEGIGNKIESWNITPDMSNIAQIAQYYCLEKGRNDLEASASEFYLHRKDSTSDIYRNLASLPFSSIVSTTHDHMFYNALKKRGKKPVCARYHFCGDNPEKVHTGTDTEPLIFYLYGAIEEPDSMVLTEDDFLDFLVKRRPFPGNIKSMLKEKNKSMLFLGFGFNHWYLRVLLHYLKVRNKGSRSFALEQTIPSENDEFKRTIIFFKKSDYKIQFFKNDLLTFTQLLKDKFSPAEPPSHGAPASKKPSIFICHASEDKDKAAKIYSKLESEGFAPWLDKENLRGGEEWDSRIERTIKTIDYFLVLQSKALIKKMIGYVNKEINLALDKQKYFRRGNPFIIPVKIEECDCLEELDFLQTLELLTDHNYEKLVKNLKTNWQRRPGGSV